MRVLEGYTNGQPIQRGFCLRCVDSAPPLPAPRSSDGRVRLGLPVLLGLAGIVVGTVGILGDALVPESNAGFGWAQRGGLALGAFLAILGTLLRADLVALGGMVVFITALSGDWFGPARSPGVGWKQQMVLGVSALLVITAVATRLALTLSRGRASGTRATPAPHAAAAAPDKQ